MSLWRKERRALPFSIDPEQITARPFYPNYSGENVTETSAFAASALLASVTLIADSVASMPVEVTRRRGQRLETVPTPSVLIKPNAHQTMFQFVHQLLLTLAIHGCVYVWAPRRAGEPPAEMLVLHPDRVADVPEAADAYMIGGDRYDSSQVKGIHWAILPGRRRGISPLQANRNLLGTTLAMDRFLAQFYGEGATPQSVLETDQNLTEEQGGKIKRAWEDAHWKHRRPAILTNGLKWRPIVTSAADNQMLEHREALVRDIARVYRIPLHLINGTGGDSQTYQNVESAGINFVRYTLLPWMRRVEDALTDLLPMPQIVRFNADEFQRADLLTRVRAQQIQIATGTLTPNEAREEENREPYEGGDRFVIPSVTDLDNATLGFDALPPEGAR